jgi:hypothetical protein
MPERLFLFVQLEFPWALGPPDGRYLLRAEADGEPERVVVLGTLGARRSGLSPGRTSRFGPLPRRAASRQRTVTPQPEPAPVATARATIVDPVSLSAERQAQAWLADLDAEREVSTAVIVLNRVLHAQRIAAADPYARAVSPGQALAIRVGWGEGEQVAEGRWLHAVELPWGRPGARARRRSSKGAALRSEERLAELLGARDRPLLCEELALRARLDLDHDRVAHAALELDHAYAAALPELRAEGRPDLALRIAELQKLRGGVAVTARAALARADLAAGSGVAAEAQAAEAEFTGGEAAGTELAGEKAFERPDDQPEQLDEDVVRHALERLEAALRARTATGFGRS